MMIGLPSSLLHVCCFLVSISNYYGTLNEKHDNRCNDKNWSSLLEIEDHDLKLHFVVRSGRRCIQGLIKVQA